MKHCLRSNGTERASFISMAAAQSFAEITPGYEGDIPHLCVCGFWHCARPSWLASPEYLTTVVTLTERVN
jgi:hypothetical protein